VKNGPEVQIDVVSNQKSDFSERQKTPKKLIEIPTLDLTKAQIS